MLNVVHRKSQVFKYGIHRLYKTWLRKPVKHSGYESGINSGKQDNASPSLGITVSLLKIEDYLKKTILPAKIICKNQHRPVNQLEPEVLLWMQLLPSSLNIKNNFNQVHSKQCDVSHLQSTEKTVSKTMN